MWKLIYIWLRDIIVIVEIFYDFKFDFMDIEEDKDFVDVFFVIFDEDIRLEFYFFWLLCFEFDWVKVFEGGYEML